MHSSARGDRGDPPAARILGVIRFPTAAPQPIGTGNAAWFPVAGAGPAPLGSRAPLRSPRLRRRRRWRPAPGRGRWRTKPQSTLTSVKGRARTSMPAEKVSMSAGSASGRARGRIMAGRIVSAAARQRSPGHGESLSRRLHGARPPRLVPVFLLGTNFGLIRRDQEMPMGIYSPPCSVAEQMSSLLPCFPAGKSEILKPQRKPNLLWAAHLVQQSPDVTAPGPSRLVLVVHAADHHCGIAEGSDALFCLGSGVPG